MRHTGPSLICAFAAVIAGCGGTKDAAMCGQVDPCGGDVVGSWKAAGSCFDPAVVTATLTEMLALSCPTGTAMTVTSSTSDRSISSSFAADGSYSATQSYSGAITFNVPAACLGSQACSDLDAAFAGFVDSGNGIVAAGCTGTGPCTCTWTNGGSSTETGSYTTAGTTMEITPAGGGPITTPYCVRGSFLHFLNLDANSHILSDVLLARGGA